MMQVAAAERTQALPPIQSWALNWFTWYCRRYISKHFHALRISCSGVAPDLDGEPTIVYLNHASWWDPLVGLILANQYFNQYANYAPMEARQLARYRLFERFGFFGIVPGTPEGARRFLQLGDAVLRHPRQALWVTAAGTFTDPRLRLAALRPGLAHLARRAERGWALPLAIEYPFWNESRPEILVRFGEPISLQSDRSLDAWQFCLTQALTQTQDALARDAIGRVSDPFQTILSGRAGIGGIYDWNRKFRAWWRGETFQPQHEMEES